MADLLWPGAHLAGDAFSTDELLDAMIRIEAEWSTALVSAGLAPPGAAASLDQLRVTLKSADAELIAVAADGGGNPVIPLIGILRERIADPQIAGWLHRGLTSQDVLDSALMMCAQRAFAHVDRELRTQIEVLVELAQQHRGSVMTARTLTQYAVPMTFGLKCSTWLTGITDALEDVGRLSFLGQFGGAAGTMAAAVEMSRSADHPASRRAVIGAIDTTARALGLEPSAPWHTSRAPLTRCGDAAASCSGAFGHIANDVATLARPEINELAEGASGGSSTMPHKSNPVLSILIRRSALTAPNLAATLHTAACDTYDERPAGAWHAEWSALRMLLRNVVSAARQSTALVSGLRVHSGQMRVNLTSATEAVTSEQLVIARIAGHEPRQDYLGLNDYYIDTRIERALKGLSNG